MAGRVRVVMYEPGMIRLREVATTDAVYPITDAVAADARRFVPVLSGDLLSTIAAQHLPGEGRVTCGDIGRGIDYHLYQEFGTSRMAGQPYMRPALYRTRSL